MKHIAYAIMLAAFSPLLCSAASPVTIGKIQSEGSSASDEFVELENASPESIALSAWSIQYKSAAGSAFSKKNFVAGAEIAANGRYVICGSGYTGTCDMRHASFSLSSSGGTVFLVSDQALLSSASSPSIIYQKTYGAAQPKDETPPEEAPGIEAKPPHEEVSPPVTSPLIVINEFMPAPQDGDEWVEIYNPTGYAHDLSGWTVADGSGKRVGTLEGLIAPAGFMLVTADSATLNNDGDAVILRDKSGQEIDKAAYGGWPTGDAKAPDAMEGISIARIGDGVDTGRDNEDFALTSAPTPGMPNRISTVGDKPQQLTTKSQNESGVKYSSSKNDFRWLAELIEDKNGELTEILKTNKNIVIVNNLYIGTHAAATDNGSRQTNAKPAATATKAATTAAKTVATAKSVNAVEGQIIAPVGLTGKDMAIVREEGRSVEVRLPKDLKNAPAFGDFVKASGSWSTAKTLTLPRLLVKKAAEFSVTGHGDPLPPIAISMAQAGEHIGEIVTLEGAVVEKQPTRFRIAEGDGSALIKQAIAVRKGERVSATGLLAKSGEDIILTPFSPESLEIVVPPPERKSFAKKAAPYALAAVPAGLLAGAIYAGRRMDRKKGGDSP
jgi:hypothetical protein